MKSTIVELVRHVCCHRREDDLLITLAVFVAFFLLFAR